MRIEQTEIRNYRSFCHAVFEDLPPMVLVARHRAAADAEDLKELVVEALIFAALIGRVGPLRSELGGAGADFIPRKAHDAGFGVARNWTGIQRRV